MEIGNIAKGLVGIIVLIGLTSLFSENKKSINWRSVGIGILMQFVFAFFVLKTDIGRNIFGAISKGFVSLLNFSSYGAEFVFGRLARDAGPDSLGFFFVFKVLPTIIFFASFMGVMYHLGIMQFIVKYIAKLVAKLLKTSGAESLSVGASIFIGQTEAPLVIRPYIASMTKSELLTIMTSGMAHISGGIMGTYVMMVAAPLAIMLGRSLEATQVQFAGHFLAACIMAAPASIIISKILVPESDKPKTLGTVSLKVEKTSSNVIEAAASGAADGVKLAINVAGMLIAFIALIALVNAILQWLGLFGGINAFCFDRFGKPLSLELLFGIIFQGFAILIGVTPKESLEVGSLMGIKLALNEFVAYSKLSDIIALKHLSERSVIIATYALCGFANFASIAIQIGGISPLAENRRGDIAALGMKAVLGGTVATMLTASIASLFI